ncbi:TIGR02569 family protein [Nocardioides ungokensis]
MGQRFGTVRGVDPVTRGRIGGSSAAGNLRLLDERDWEWRRRGPTPQAVREFGVREDALRRLPGGAGHVWTDGRLVLKPVGCVPEHAWVCEVFATWVSDEVRVPEPIAPKDGADPRWSIEGWGAHVFAPGRDADLVRELPLVKHASDAFHHAVEHLPRPAFLDTRDDPWAFGDRLAWEDAEPEGDAPTLEVIRRLQDSLRPVGSRSQVIHGDILPNVLVKTGGPPAVIDWPPYFRPVGTANAVAITDAVTFRDAPLALLDAWETGEEWNQLLIRALLYRLGPTGVFAVRNRLMGSLVRHVERVRPVVDAILSRC